MPAGDRQQIDQQESAPEPPAAMPDEAVVIPPARVADAAVLTGAHGTAELGGMHELLGLSSPAQRRRFVLQLQRTAGNAAVCRWLAEARARFLERHPDTGDDPPPDENAPISR